MYHVGVLSFGCLSILRAVFLLLSQKQPQHGGQIRAGTSQQRLPEDRMAVIAGLRCVIEISQRYILLLDGDIGLRNLRRRRCRRRLRCRRFRFRLCGRSVYVGKHDGSIGFHCSVSGIAAHRILGDGVDDLTAFLVLIKVGEAPLPAVRLGDGLGVDLCAIGEQMDGDGGGTLAVLVTG